MLTFLASLGLVGLGQPFGLFKFHGVHELFGLALGWRCFSGYFRHSNLLDPSVKYGLRNGLMSSIPTNAWFDVQNTKAKRPIATGQSHHVEIHIALAIHTTFAANIQTAFTRCEFLIYEICFKNLSTVQRLLNSGFAVNVEIPVAQNCDLTTLKWISHSWLPYITICKAVARVSHLHELVKLHQWSSSNLIQNCWRPLCC